MLKSAGLPVYQHLNVHGYWQIGASKMSKSVGNVVEALTMADKYGGEAFRYFLMREMNFGLDSEFSEDRLVARHNSDLANDLGNLWQRSLTMVQKFSPSLKPQTDEVPPQADEPIWRERIEKLLGDYRASFEAIDPRGALVAVWEWVNLLNKTIDEEAPWALAKDPSKKDRLAAVLSRLLDGLALIGTLIEPVMPLTGTEIWRRLGLDPKDMTLKAGRGLKFSFDRSSLSAGSAFFPRIETGERPKGSGAGHAPKASGETLAEGLASLEDFKKLDLRVAKILSAEKVKKSDKLIKLGLSLGDEERTVVAGIGQFYQPDALLGRLVVIVANLAPVKLMGVESRGMVLAASVEGALALTTVSSDLPPGAKVS
jgi:methionyl-tRNA synthetase